MQPTTQSPKKAHAAHEELPRPRWGIPAGFAFLSELTSDFAFMSVCTTQRPFTERERVFQNAETSLSGRIVISDNSKSVIPTRARAQRS